MDQGRVDQFPLTSCVDCTSKVWPGNSPGEGDRAPKVLQQGQAELWTQPTCMPAPGLMLWPGGTAACSEIISFFLEKNSEEGAFELFLYCKQAAKGLLGCLEDRESVQCSFWTWIQASGAPVLLWRAVLSLFLLGRYFTSQLGTQT